MNYLSRDYLEELADSILLDCFGAEFMLKHKSINVDYLASYYLGLTVSYIRLSEDGKITSGAVTPLKYMRGLMLSMKAISLLRR